MVTWECTRLLACRDCACPCMEGQPVRRWQMALRLPLHEASSASMVSRRSKELMLIVHPDKCPAIEATPAFQFLQQASAALLDSLRT